MVPTAAPAPRTGSPLPTGLPAGARSAVRGAARAVVATVGAVLAGLVLALPAGHLPFTPVPTGPQTAVVFSADHRPISLTAGPLGGAGPAAHTVVRPVTPATPAVVQVLAAPRSAALGAQWVLLAAALVGLSRPLTRRRVPVRAPHLGPAPLRGPPAGLAPAP